METLWKVFIAIYIVSLFQVNGLFFHNILKWVFPNNSEREPLTASMVCGTLIQDRIIGGKEAPPYAWPWMVSLKSFTEHHFCGGVLISKRHVLTAAHCLPLYKYFPYLIKVFVGSGHLEVGDRFFVDSVIVHPSYGKRSMYDSDLAILSLSSDVNFYEAANAVCLPHCDITKSLYRESATILGWGYAEEEGELVQNLREVYVLVLDDGKCDIYGEYFLNDVMICAGQEGGGKDACKGDSGGPLLWLNELGHWELHGVVSFGKGCGRGRYPGAYTKVVYYKQWILNTIFK